MKGKREPKRNFLVKIFQKRPKNAFSGLFFFSTICLRRTKLGQNSGKAVVWESSKNQFGRFIGQLSSLVPTRTMEQNKLLNKPLKKPKLAMFWTKLCAFWRIFSYCWEPNANFLCVANYTAHKLCQIEWRLADWSC